MFGNITVPLIVAGVFGVTTGEKIFLIQMNLISQCQMLNTDPVGGYRMYCANYFFVSAWVPRTLDFLAKWPDFLKISTGIKR